MPAAAAMLASTVLAISLDMTAALDSALGALATASANEARSKSNQVVLGLGRGSGLGRGID